MRITTDSLKRADTFLLVSKVIGMASIDSYDIETAASVSLRFF